MPVINKKILSRIATDLRPSLEQIELCGINDWEPIFSNGHGYGDGNTLVIDMKPSLSDVICEDIVEEASESIEVLSILDDIEPIAPVSFIEIVSKIRPGFMVIVRFADSEADAAV